MGGVVYNLECALPARCSDRVSIIDSRGRYESKTRFVATQRCGRHGDFNAIRSVLVEWDAKMIKRSWTDV